MVSSARMLRDQTAAAATAAATRESCESRRPLRKTKVANYALLLSLLSSILSFLSTLYSPLSSLTLQAFNAIRFDAAFFAVSSVHPPVASSLHLTVCLPPPLPPPSLSLCLAHCRAHISPLLLPSQLAVNTKYNCLTVHKNEEIKDPFVCVHRVSIELHSNNNNNDLNSSSNPQQQQLNSTQREIFEFARQIISHQYVGDCLSRNRSPSTTLRLSVCLSPLRLSVCLSHPSNTAGISLNAAVEHLLRLCVFFFGGCTSEA